LLDRHLIREDPDRVIKGVKAKHVDVDVDKIVALDRELLDIMKESEALKHERNVKSEEVGKKKRAGEDADELQAHLKEVSNKIKTLESRDGEINEELGALLLTLPNLPDKSVPVGRDETANIVTKHWGDVKEPFDGLLPHWDIGEKLGILDLEGGRRVSGRGFIVFRGDGARLCRALLTMMIDIHREQGYEEVWVPFLVNRDSMTGTGQLPKLEDDMYRADVDDLFLIPTAEVPVTNLERDTTITADRLPIKYTAYTPCFRREAGSHGADTRGLLRVHQFDKVEMVKFVHPDSSYDELESLTKDATDVVEDLELPYRIVELSTGDLSFAAAKCYDIEVYSPGVDKWLEVSSCSNFESFQARRANIRLKKSPGEKHRFVHTLNGSGLALPRIIAAILEHHQTPTGRVRIPAKLVPYMNGQDYLG